MAGAAHVGVDPTMGSVCPPPHLGSTVDLTRLNVNNAPTKVLLLKEIYLNVLNDQVVGVQSLVLGVALSVLEELQKELSGLQRPSSLGGSMNLDKSSN